MSNTNLLIIHQGALGDFILTFPAITRLQKYYKPIDVLCQSQPGKLARALGIVENSYPAESAYVASLFSNQIDPRITAILEQYEKVVVVTRSERLEQSVNQAAANLCCRFPPKPPADRRIHVAKFILDNLLDCGLIRRSDVTLNALPLPIPDKHLQNSRRVLLHPGAGSVRKRWPLSNFLVLESMLKTAGLKPEFVTGPAERDLAKMLQQSAQTVYVLDDLLELLDLIGSAGGYIGNDSGASHLAAYCGLPTTVIFGPADPERWTPVGRAVQIVRPGLECRPCFETEPDNCDGLQCLEATGPKQVVEAFFSIYENA